MTDVTARKDEHDAHPVPTAWRPMLTAIANAFARGDYSLAAALPDIDPVEPPTAAQVRYAVESYGATLVPLPEATWETSICQWYGSHWEVLVDLWTAEEGPSDLVLQSRVYEVSGGVRCRVDLVYVP